MVDRVSLNLPPRLIESARAAQYANREALGGRTLADKIKAKVKARRAAVVRAQPLTPDQTEDVLEPEDPLKWRIWRKRRPGKAVDAGVAWLYIDKIYTIISDSELKYDPSWSNGEPGGSINTWDPSTGPTTRRSPSSIRSTSATLEYVVIVGARSGETWNRFSHSLSLSYALDFYIQETHAMGLTTTFTTFDRYASLSSSLYTNLWYSIFPAGQSDLILVVTIAQYALTGFFEDSKNQLYSNGTFSLQTTKQVSFLVTPSSVTQLTHAIPAFMQKQIDDELTAYTTGMNGPSPSVESPNVFIRLGFSQSPIGVYSTGFQSASSASFEGFSQNGTYNTVSPQQAKTSYAAYSGNAEIPVLGYRRDNPSTASTPTTERGTFGIIPGASVTGAVTSGMLAAGLDDELEQRPGPNAQNQPEPVGMVIAYDYHDRTYCRDQLTRLGIGIP